jgi:hypothetical protein
VGAQAKPDDRPSKPVKVNVLRCRKDSCRGLLAFEETDEGYLLGQVLEMAEVADGGRRFFPCPKCGGRLLVEEYVHSDGKLRVRVSGFEPATA